MKELTKGCPDIILYGCLGKYVIFEYRKERRVCWLPEEKNHKAKILHVGHLDDIIELIPREKLRERLLVLLRNTFLCICRCCAFGAEFICQDDLEEDLLK